MASVRARSIRAGRSGCLRYAGDDGGARPGGRRITTGSTTTNVTGGHVSIHRIEIVGTTISQTAESTWPWANKVTVQ